MTAVDHQMLVAMLDRLKLTAIRDQLDTLLDEAARSQMTLREALAFLVTREIARRDERRIYMAGKIAQFPFVRELDGFDFTRSRRWISAKSGSWRPAAGLLMATRSCSLDLRVRARHIWRWLSGARRSGISSTERVARYLGIGRLDDGPQRLLTSARRFIMSSASVIPSNQVGVRNPTLTE